MTLPPAAGRRDLDRCFELEMTGYSQPASAFYITCSASCTQYYQQYINSTTDAELPIELVEAEREAQAKQETATMHKVDAIIAEHAHGDGATAATGKRGGRKSRKEEPAGAAAAAPPPAGASADTPSKEDSKTEEDEFVYQPPTEIAPHICSCLIPKKGQRAHALWNGD